MARFGFAVAALASLLPLGCASEGEPEGPIEFFDESGDEAKADGLVNRSTDDKSQRWRGQTEFLSAAPYYRVWGPWLRTAAGDPAALEDSARTTRDVVESDVYKLEGTTLYVLNPYRGLQIIDVANPDRPRRLGRLDIHGNPKEMYVRGNRVYALVSDHFRFEQDRSFRGSRVLAIDVADRARPRLVAALDVAGNFGDSRMVGDVVYVVSTEYPEWSFESGTTTREQTHVLGINVAATRPLVVDKVTFPGTAHQIHVTPEYMFLAQYAYPNTHVVALGIADAGGRIVRAGEIDIPGSIQDRFQMNYRNGYLRAVTHHWDNQGTVFVKTVQVTPTGLTPAGSLELPGVGQLLATKYDGDKVYFVHIVRIDPLDVVDLSNPRQPVRQSSLVIPGWLEHLEIRGNRVLGIGVDNSGGQNKLAVALYDVANPAATREMARAILSPNWAWSSGFADDRAFRMLDAQKLLLVPYSAWSEAGADDAVQLVDFDLAAGTLRTRGRIEAAGSVQRAFPIAQRVGAFSERELRVANIDDRDHPVLTGALELARNIRSFVLLDNVGLQLVGDWGQLPELRAVSRDKVDAEKTEVLSTIAIGKDAEKVFAAGTSAVVVERRWLPGDDLTPGSQQVVLTLFDFARPSAPLQRGSITLAVDGFGGGGFAPWFRRANISDVVQVRADLFAVANLTGEGRRFQIVSFADAARPRVVSTRDLDAADQYIDMRVLRGSLYVTHFEETATGSPLPVPPGGVAVPAEDARPGASLILPPPDGSATRRLGKYFVTKLYVSPTGRTTVSRAVNIPGRFVDSDDNGNLITLDQRWASHDGHEHQHKHLTKLTVSYSDGRARLVDLLNIPDGVSDIKVVNGHAYFTTYEEWAGTPVTTTRQPTWELHIVDVRPARLRGAEHVTVSEDGPGSLLDVSKVGSRTYAMLTLGWGGVAVYDVTWTDFPFLSAFVPANGWFGEAVVDASRHQAVVWSGFYGITPIPLAQ